MAAQHEVVRLRENMGHVAPWESGLVGGSPGWPPWSLTAVAAYRSVLRGPQPEFHAYASWQEELDGILRQVRKWTGGDVAIAVSVPTKKQFEQVESYLSDHGVPAGSIGSEGPRLNEGVHVGTLQRFKGLEYQRMILAGISPGT
jgi:hypothetical protein